MPGHSTLSECLGTLFVPHRHLGFATPPTSQETAAYSGLRGLSHAGVWIFIRRTAGIVRRFLFLFPFFAMESRSNRPVEVFRASGVSASVFKNLPKTEDRATPFYKVTLERFYKDGDKPKSTNSLGRNDLPVAALLLQKAWNFIVEAEAKTRKDS